MTKIKIINSQAEMLKCLNSENQSPKFKKITNNPFVIDKNINEIVNFYMLLNSQLIVITENGLIEAMSLIHTVKEKYTKTFKNISLKLITSNEKFEEIFSNFIFLNDIEPKLSSGIFSLEIPEGISFENIKIFDHYEAFRFYNEEYHELSDAYTYVVTKYNKPI